LLSHHRATVAPHVVHRKEAMKTSLRRAAHVPAVSLACAGLLASGAGAATPRATAACSASLTPAVTEGPYYKEGSPRRSNIRSGATGRPLVVSGVVRTASCKRIAHARIEFWQADGSGNYDNSGYRLRGHVFTDSKGRYTVRTVVPGLYPGRTRHIHVKVKAPGGPTLTSQLYFPGEARNSSDGLFNSRTLLRITHKGTSWSARFNFAVRTG
jgi:protocatechuate 3,4-dioxygenase beta subunit